MSDKQRGLYSKYRILKRETGEEIEGPSFVLRPDRDEAAMSALYAYAAVTPNQKLGEDLEQWLDAMDIPAEGTGSVEVDQVESASSAAAELPKTEGPK